MRKVSLLLSIPSWRPLLPFIGRPWSKRHPACLYMYTSPPIADNAIHLSLGLLAGTPHQAFSTKPHRRPRHPSMNRLNCHQNRYLPGGRANVRLGSRHAGESGTDTRLLPRVLLIQSPHTIPSLISSHHATWGKPPPKCKTPPDNSTTTIPLCHAGKSVADQEQKAKATEKQKGQKENTVKTPPSRHPPPIRRFCYMPLLPRNTYSWMLSSYRCFGRSSHDGPAGRFIASLVPYGGQV